MNLLPASVWTASRSCTRAFTTKCSANRQILQHGSKSQRSQRQLSSSPLLYVRPSNTSTTVQTGEKSYTQPAGKLSQEVTPEEQSRFDKAVADDKAKQIRTPWHREGSEKAPVARQRSAGAMTKGKLLTTPTRLFKLILPLTTRDHNTDRKSIEPLALLVHPQQPLSYLERLIQSELPLITSNGKEKIPEVHFCAEDSLRDSEGAEPGSAHESNVQEAENAIDGNEDESHTHLRPRTPDSARELRRGPGEGGVESYSGLGNESDPDNARPTNFVRWSKSTEIGDFVRDAARGQEFAVQIEGAPNDIRIGVPSFGDRTYYLRIRLRKKAKEISSMADLKKECDFLAHRSANRIAYAGFGGMLAWGSLVAWLTFETSLGWDYMEPICYLVGLVGLLGGYGWFLFNRREASYQSAMNLTVSRRQNQLYQSKGLDLAKYNRLVDEANSLRKEIRMIASEYDVDWDEKRDAQDENVVEALKEQRKSKRDRKEIDSDGDD